MLKKAAIPVSVGVFILGLVLIVLSFARADSGGKASESAAVGTDTAAADVGGSATSEAWDFSGFSTSTSSAQAAPGAGGTGQSPPAPSNSGNPNAGSSMPPTGSPPTASPTTIVFPAQPGPASPGLPGFGLPSRDSYVPPTSATAAFNLVPPNTCSTFQECAQKLYDNWVSGAVCFDDGFSDAYATRAVIDAMSAYCGRYQGNWSPTLVPGAGRYQLVGTSDRTSTPRVIIFSQVPGQTDPFVRSVQFQ